MAFNPRQQPQNLVRINSLHIGPLEFHDCLVGVSDTPFPNKGDGFIGTDVFAPYLISLDYPAGKLTLAPLPALPCSEREHFAGRSLYRS